MATSSKSSGTDHAKSMSTAYQFKRTRDVFKPLIQEISSKGSGRSDLLEAAFFAYAHRNPLIDRIFWGRLKLVERYVLDRRFSRILDYGCGSGVMSYCLGSSGLNVTASDIDPRPLEEIRNRMAFPPSVSFIETPKLSESRFGGQFDCIVVLDVLEHIEDLTETISLFKHLLRPEGEAIVSGPTENKLYHIGRKLAGKEFTGAYHKSDVRKVRSGLSHDFLIHEIASFPPIMPLFEIFSAKNGRTKG